MTANPGFVEECPCQTHVDGCFLPVFVKRRSLWGETRPGAPERVRTGVPRMDCRHRPVLVQKNGRENYREIFIFSNSAKAQRIPPNKGPAPR